MRNKIFAILIPLLFVCLGASAQIGEHRSELSIGVTGGMSMNSIDFDPTIKQKSLMAFTAFQRSSPGFFRVASFRRGCFALTVCSFAAAIRRRIDLSRSSRKRAFVSAINLLHCGSGICSSRFMVLWTTALVCASRITGTISFSPARVSSLVGAAYW